MRPKHTVFELFLPPLCLVAAFLICIGVGVHIIPSAQAGDTSEADSGLLLNDLFLAVEVGRQADEFPLQIRDSEASSKCFFQGSAQLNPETFRAHIKVLRRSCLDSNERRTEEEMEGFVVDDDGYAGLRVNCTSVYANGIGNRLCLRGEVPAGTEVKVLPRNPSEPATSNASKLPVKEPMPHEYQLCLAAILVENYASIVEERPAKSRSELSDCKSLP